MGRNSNGRSSIYEGSDGWWHGRVTVGIKDDGKPDRRHAMAKTKAEVTAKVRKLEKLRDEGRVPKAGQRWRVAAWLTFWLEHPLPAERIGEHLFRLRGRRARPPHPRNRRALARQANPRARRKALHEDDGQRAFGRNRAPRHRTIRNALNEAVRRGHIARNPVLLAKAPRLTDEETEPYTNGEVNRLLTVRTPQRLRWVIALALGYNRAKRSDLNGNMWTSKRA